MGKLLSGSAQHRELVVLEIRLKECEGAAKDAEACAKEASTQTIAKLFLKEARVLRDEERDLRQAMRVLQEDVSIATKKPLKRRKLVM